MEFELGQTYSGYKILDVVRRSRSAVQYRVQNTLAQRVESLRTLTPAAVEDPDAAERFLREVGIRAQLSHPHILTFYRAVPIEGRMAMTTELPDSMSLAERLKMGPMPWRPALDITSQLLDALACVHQQGFVHCDITPENVLFGAGGFCKLADFSSARPMVPVNHTGSGAVTGNPRYISPEQIKGQGNLDARSDLYSVGVVLYEMLCGRPPFESRSQFELMMAHVNQAPAAPSGVNEDVPGLLDALVLKALAKEVRDRYASTAEFAAEIARVAGELSAADEVSASVTVSVGEAAEALVASVSAMVDDAGTEAYAAAVPAMEGVAVGEPVLGVSVAEPPIVEIGEVVDVGVATALEVVAAAEPQMQAAVLTVEVEDSDPDVEVVADVEPHIMQDAEEAVGVDLAAPVVAAGEPQIVDAAEVAVGVEVSEPAEGIVGEAGVTAAMGDVEVAGVVEVIAAAEPRIEAAAEVAAGVEVAAPVVEGIVGEAVVAAAVDDVEVASAVEVAAAGEPQIVQAAEEAVGVEVSEPAEGIVGEAVVTAAVDDVEVARAVEVTAAAEPQIVDAAEVAVGVEVAAPVVEGIVGEAVVTAAVDDVEVASVVEVVAAGEPQIVQAAEEAVGVEAAEPAVEVVATIEPQIEAAVQAIGVEVAASLVEVIATGEPQIVGAAEVAVVEVAEPAVEGIVGEVAVTQTGADLAPGTAVELVGAAAPQIVDAAEMAIGVEAAASLVEVIATGEPQIVQAAEEAVGVEAAEPAVEGIVGEVAVTQTGPDLAAGTAVELVGAAAPQIVDAGEVAIGVEVAYPAVEVVAAVEQKTEAAVQAIAVEVSESGVEGIVGEVAVTQAGADVAAGTAAEAVATAEPQIAEAADAAAGVEAADPAVEVIATVEQQTEAAALAVGVEVLGPVAEPAAVTAESVPVVDADAEPAAAIAPRDSEALKENLWAAAEMVAEAASGSVAPPVADTSEPLPLAALPPEPPIPELKFERVVDVAPVPFMTTISRPNSMQWAIFGGTAAFLGVIWAAIWFAVGK